MKRYLYGMTFSTLLIHYKLLNGFLLSTPDLFLMLTQGEKYIKDIIVREIIYSLWDNFLYMKSMKSSIVSYKQSLQNQGAVNYTDKYFFVVVAPNL